jgi:hypothetical protein
VSRGGPGALQVGRRRKTCRPERRPDRYVASFAAGLRGLVRPPAGVDAGARARARGHGHRGRLRPGAHRTGRARAVPELVRRSAATTTRCVGGGTRAASGRRRGRSRRWWRHSPIERRRARPRGARPGTRPGRSGSPVGATGDREVWVRNEAREALERLTGRPD